MKKMIRAGFIPALFMSGGAMAQDLSLILPLDCTLGETCFVQNYVDHDPGPGAQDFTCAGLSYDGHKGTDFALPDRAAMERGVDVYAAAPGVVRGMRDGMIDKLYTPEEDARIDGKDCGNGAVIVHDGGWETQYCHMKQGSMQVSSGQRVEAGTVLGQVGLSGRTQFPHLHISVRKDGEQVDPFTPGAGIETCGQAEGATLWADAIAYMPGAVLSAGFATDVPSYDAIKAGTAEAGPIAADAPALVLWGYAYGGRQKDVLELRIDGPDGRFFDTTQLIKKTQAQFYRAGGKKLRDPLTPGKYVGTVLLIRDGEEISRRETEVTID